MKLEHLIQAYKVNNIQVELKEMNNENEKAGVITFANGISASYLLDDEDIVIAMKIFFNCLTTDELKIQNQISHIIKILNIMQNTIMLLSNIPQKECNMILEKLGLFDNTFIEEKEIEVIKIWDDDNNRNGKRPINITLQVKNGEKIVEESVVSGKDNWKYIFRLPKYGEDGNEIEYTVDEKEINKYYEKIIDGYTIVNKYIYNEDDIQKNDNIDLVDTSDIDIIIYICTFILAIVGIVTIILFIRKSKSNRKK